MSSPSKEEYRSSAKQYISELQDALGKLEGITVDNIGVIDETTITCVHEQTSVMIEAINEAKADIPKELEFIYRNISYAAQTLNKLTGRIDQARSSYLSGELAEVATLIQTFDDLRSQTLEFIRISTDHLNKQR